MTAAEIAMARKRLEHLRLELIHEIRGTNEASRDMEQGDVPDIGDMSVRTYDRDVLYNLSEVQRQRMRDIDAALERIEQGEYGICLRCGEEIAPKRLDVRPFSRYCIDCKMEIERFGE